MFKKLGLISPLLKAIAEKGYTEPSPIQEKAIPVVLKGKDVLASAQTGTGKTAGFTLPMLQLLSQGETGRRRKIRALVITPTRELAAQIYDNVKEYSTHLDIKATVVFGGVNANPQIRTLRNGIDILIATPGRLLDLENQNELSLRDVEILVLDEADRMLDMGFVRDINKVVKLVPSNRQTLMFSATFSKDIKKLASQYLNNPVMVEAAPENTTAEKVVHKAFPVNKKEKPEVVVKLIKEGNMKQVLVFTRTKHKANRIAEKLNKSGIEAAAIHGDKSQGARTKALAGFKEGTVAVLVATDIAARGLDIPLLPHVINYELPNVPEDYVHRIGRTARAGASGEAVSLVSHDETPYLKDIEKLLGFKIPQETIQGFERGSIEDFAEEEAAFKKQNQGKNGRRPNNRNSGGKSGGKAVSGQKKKWRR
jgi:ATP-dependent RNA helicase RhlE|tara:strand:- start:17764 stop:19035 length:1272 start_codon:yes stop_codon:yes gene_type:complete